jgi:hypothetical protein
MTTAEPTATLSTLMDFGFYSGGIQSGGLVNPSIHSIQLSAAPTQDLHLVGSHSGQ